MIEIVPLSDDLAVLDRVDVRDAEMRLDPANTTSDPPVHARDNRLPRATQVSQDRRVFSLPCLSEAFKEKAYRRATADRARLDPGRRWRQLGVNGV